MHQRDAPIRFTVVRADAAGGHDAAAGALATRV